MYEVDTDGVPHVQFEDRLYTQRPGWLDDVAQTNEGLQGLGPRPQWLEKGVRFDHGSDVELSALAMLDITRQMHERGLSRPPSEALPIYVEGDSPWQKVAP